MGTQRSPARRRRDAAKRLRQEAAWAARSSEVTVSHLQALDEDRSSLAPFCQGPGASRDSVPEVG